MKRNRLVLFLVRIGFCQVSAVTGNVVWPFSAPPRHVFSSWRGFIGHCRFWGPFYTFRNLPGSVKWKPGALLPRRWGFGFFGWEFWQRGSW